mmetsp:Transcript_94427/g.304933  ORF Transcript_94427/g.304933 Transcript_94427/m.304933 type:complete len:473 (-) Transcript_94427:26-1444(-)
MTSRDLQDVVDDLGFGWAQVQSLVLGGGTYAADGSELLLIGTVTNALSKEWKLHAFQRGIIVSVVFVGTLVGNFLSGMIGDVHGRRLPIILSYLGVFVFSVCSVFAWDVWSLATSRIFVGIGFGVGVPAWNALGGEICPSGSRLVVNGLSQILFALGEVYSASLVYMQDPHMRHLEWRVLLLLGALPALVLLLFTCRYLLESPRHFAAKGQLAEAKEVLQEMRRMNGKDDVSVEFQSLYEVKTYSSRWEEGLQKLRIVFGRHLLYSTLTTCFSTFVLNLVFYGGLYAFPQVLPELELAVTPAFNLLLGALFEIPGFVAGIILGSYMPRKSLMIAYLIVVCASTVIFTLAASRIDQAGSRYIMEMACQMGFIGTKVFTSVGFLVVYLYSMEIYPTVARTTGTGLCIASGRTGAVIAPLLFEQMADVFGNQFAYFHFVASCCLVNAVLIFFLPYETAGQKLVDHHDNDMEPLKP